MYCLTEIIIDPEFAELCPPLRDEEYLGLVESITSEGCRDPILVWKTTIKDKKEIYENGIGMCKNENCTHYNKQIHYSKWVYEDGRYICAFCQDYGVAPEEITKNIIVDGHNRYKICKQHKIPYQTKEISFIDKDDAKIWIIENQFARRNLSQVQRIDLAFKLEKVIADIEKQKRKDTEGRPKKTEVINNFSLEDVPIQKIDVEKTTTNRELGKVAGVSESQIKKYRKVKNKASKETLKKIEDGELTIGAAYHQIEREDLKADLTNKIPDLPTGKYRVIYADPPWKYGDTMSGLDEYGYGIAAEKHYITMSIDELCFMPINEKTEKDAVLFLWTTSPMLEDAFKVIKAWGFKYKTSFVWDKIKHNMGHYNSVRHEFLLVCTKGSCTPDANKLFDSVQMIERSKEHSEKPEEFRQIIDTLYTHGKKLEMFARKKVDGWDHYGTN